MEFIPDRNVVQNLAWLTQLGLSILAPPVLCILGCYWLQGRFSLGGWIMVLGVILGLGASVSSALHFYKVVRKQADKTGSKGPKSFNSHE